MLVAFSLLIIVVILSNYRESIAIRLIINRKNSKSIKLRSLTQINESLKLNLEAVKEEDEEDYCDEISRRA